MSRVPDVNEYVGKPRDTQREDELARALRELPEEQCFKFILDYLDHDVVVGLSLANRCLRGREYFERLLRRGLETADVSSIRFWLRACLPRLGPRRVTGLLSQLADVNPAAVVKAMYYSKVLIKKQSPDLSEALREVESRALNRLPESEDDP
jgi:hypothetical protein